jgi:hypothetical protein
MLPSEVATTEHRTPKCITIPDWECITNRNPMLARPNPSPGRLLSNISFFFFFIFFFPDSHHHRHRLKD